MSASTISEFYCGKSVLITGATGFMGKVLVEKLLRSCPGVVRLYLLMRPKGSKDVSERLQDMLKSQLFDHLRTTAPEVLTKLTAVQGDITFPSLGLSQTDTELLSDNVNVVFHAAATIKFDEALKMSLEMNVQGTSRLVELCHKMKDLVALIHVSTAYCNCDREEIDEIVYPPPADPYKLLQLVDWMDDDNFNYLTPKLIGKRPNTYTFTKALAEHVLIEESGSLPVSIVRPSIVCAAWKEPISGWVDNLNGATGLILGAGKGVLRTLHCDGDLVADIIPVDIPINLMIVAAWYTATQRPDKGQVFNCVSGIERPIRWRDIKTYGLKALENNAMAGAVMYPGLSFTKNKQLHAVENVLKHWVPAYVLDMLASLSGRKPIMRRIVQKMEKAAACLEYFTTHQWKFNNDNVQSLSAMLSDVDQNNFNFSIANINWSDYIRDYCLGIKKFVLKEDLSKLSQHKANLNRVWWVQQCMQILTVLASWKVIMMRSLAAREAWARLMRSLLRMITYLPILNRI